MTGSLTGSRSLPYLKIKRILVVKKSPTFQKGPKSWLGVISLPSSTLQSQPIQKLSMILGVSSFFWQNKFSGPIRQLWPIHVIHILKALVPNLGSSNTRQNTAKYTKYGIWARIWVKLGIPEKILQNSVQSRWFKVKRTPSVKSYDRILFLPDFPLKL